MRRRPDDPVVMEFVTKAKRPKRHLALLRVMHTACGRPLEGLDLHGRVTFPWQPDDACKTCERVLYSGGLGFYITRRGTVLTPEYLDHLAEEAEQTTAHRRPRNYEPTFKPTSEPGPDAMRWRP